MKSTERKDKVERIRQTGHIKEGRRDGVCACVCVCVKERDETGGSVPCGRCVCVRERVCV